MNALRLPMSLDDPPEDYADDWDEDRDCTFCGGDGLVECDDFLQCFHVHYDGWHPCDACGGSGLAKDQTSW